MSEEPEDIAHARRVGTADEVGEARHVEHVGTLQVHTAGFAEERLRVVKWVAMIVGSLAVVLALGTAAFVLWSRNSSADQVSRQVQELKEQLAVAQQSLDDATAKSDETAICADRLSRAISAASQGESSALIHLVIQLARQEPYDINQAVEADTTYSNAVQMRDSWVESGRPLPCPVPE